MQQPQPDYQHYGPNFPTVYPIELLIRQLPRHSYLPSRPVTFTKDEELYLRRVIAHDLKGFDRKTLKDLYMELTSFDKHLTGFIEYHDLSLVLSKYQVRQYCFVISSVFFLVLFKHSFVRSTPFSVKQDHS